MSSSIPLIFDGHNDILLRRRGRPLEFLTGALDAHIDLERARAGNLGGGFFAVFVPHDPARPAPPEFDPDLTSTGQYEVPLPEPLTQRYALETALEMAASLYRIARESDGALRVVKTVADIEACFASKSIAAILHFEGADPIDEDLNALVVLYEAGLRSLGIVWSRPNAFGHGVPFAFPRSPGTGPGLTNAGVRLVRACNELGILVDLSHINERGFWNVAELTKAPLAVSHACAHALSPSARNLTDEQLDAVAQTNGVVGVNFHTGFLRADGHIDEHTPIAEIVRHVDYMVNRMGVDHVAFGSDFDGATVPAELDGVRGMPKLIEALAAMGYDNDALRKIAHGNWLRVLGDTWR